MENNNPIMNTATFSPFSRPLYVMLKPVGSRCNLACKYCYYLEKAGLYPDDHRHVLSDELLEKFIKEYIGAQTMQDVLFYLAWWRNVDASSFVL